MKHIVEIDAVDIPTMYRMDLGEYRQYLETELFFIDHHDVLRSALGEYPLTVTREQLRELIRYLQSLDSKVGAERA